MYFHELSSDIIHPTNLVNLKLTYERVILQFEDSIQFFLIDLLLRILGRPPVAYVVKVRQS